MNSVVLNEGLVSLLRRRSPSRDATARLSLVRGLWSVVGVVILLLMEVVFGWGASARPEGFPTKLARTLPRVPEGSNLNWVGRFSASRELQLINILHIPNTPLFFSCWIVSCASICER